MKPDLNWNLQVSNTSREVVGTTSSDDVSGRRRIETTTVSVVNRVSAEMDQFAPAPRLRRGNFPACVSADIRHIPLHAGGNMLVQPVYVATSAVKVCHFEAVSEMTAAESDRPGREG